MKTWIHNFILKQYDIANVLWVAFSIPSGSLRVEVSLFVLSPKIEDRDEVEVATGRSTKRPLGHQNTIL
jgi:hypothetical protein